MTAPKLYNTTTRQDGRSFVHLEWDDFTSIMDLVWAAMDAKDKKPYNPGAVGDALDLVIERLAYLRKWTDPDHWADLRAGKTVDDSYTVAAL